MLTLLAVASALPAPAQTMGTVPLGDTATRAIQTSLNGALASARKDEKSVRTAIFQALQDAVGKYGVEYAATIGSTVMVTAETAGASMEAVGAGFGEASTLLAPESCRGNGGNPIQDCRVAATAIAQMVGNEARLSEVVAYQRTVIALGYPKLATIAGRSSPPVGAINPGAGGSLPGSGFIGGAGAGGGCLTPSCTHL